MRILLVADYGTPDGGAEIATIQLLNGLQRLGHDVRLFASSARTSSLSSAADTHCFGTTGSFRTLVQTANPSAMSGLRRVLRAYRPDVVHVGAFLTQLSPLILPLLRGRKSVYHAHWLRAICPTGMKVLPSGRSCAVPMGVECYRAGCLPSRDMLPLMAQMHLVKRWRDVFSRVVANSMATRDALHAGGFADVQVIPCGVDAEPLTAPMSATPTVFFGGRLTRQKGVHHLLSAWSAVRQRVPHATLVIVGDGPERGALERMASAGVRFLGSLPHAELSHAAGAAWVQVVPSVGFEPFGLVAAEAMMRARAVVASRVGGLPEIVTHGQNGLLVEPSDPTALADALITLLGDRARCEQLGENGRAVALQQFSADLYVTRFAAVYQSLIESERVNG